MAQVKEFGLEHYPRSVKDPNPMSEMEAFLPQARLPVLTTAGVGEEEEASQVGEGHKLGVGKHTCRIPVCYGAGEL